MKTLPLSMKHEQHSLKNHAPYELLKIHIETDSDPIIQRLSLGETVDWNNYTWPHVSFNLSGIGEKGGGEKSRPKLILPNPEGLYNYYIQKGFLDNARITYYKVHPEDINNPDCLEYKYYVSRIVEVNNKLINCQLSALSDGNTFKLPARRFTQPEFNQVRI